MRQKISDRIPEALWIASRANPRIVALAKLSQPKYRREEKLFLAEGVKLSREAAGLPEVRYILISSDDGYADASVLDIAAARPSGCEVLILPAAAFSKVSTESAPQGVITVLQNMERLHRPWEPASLKAAPDSRLLAVDGVQDPGNLGTIIRTARAFGYRRLYLGGCADIYHPRTVRASMGALFRTEIVLCPDLPAALTALRSSGRRILAAALSQNALQLGEAMLDVRDCIVIGNEGHGVSPEVCAASDALIRIPMEEGCESLNAAGAAAVLMWEYYRTFG